MIAAIDLRRLGTSASESQEMMRTLQAAKQKKCTVYGYYSITYGGSCLYPPLQGFGHGNGAGPVIWVAISTVLLAIMRQRGFRFSIFSSLSFTSLVLAGFAFVDDTDIIHASNDPYTLPSDVLDQSKNALTT